MMDRQTWVRRVRRTAFLTVGLAAALIFGVLVLAGGDWIPGTVIVVASALGLARELPVVHELCSSPVPGPPTDTPTG
jgi:hypothetical protein